MRTVKHQFYCGDVLEVLKTLPDESVHCVVTSPPYWSLRDYGVEGQLGLEKVPDCLGWATGNPCGECYTCKMVQVFREVRRVLRKDGTVWLNLGDSYAGSWGNYHPYSPPGKHGQRLRQTARWNRRAYDGKEDFLPPTARPSGGLKEKDLCGIPWRVAFALQADGWWLRSDIIYAKKNPLPESVKDRPTHSHEYLFLLAKSKQYFYDADAIREPHVEPWRGKGEHESSNPHSRRMDGAEKGLGRQPVFVSAKREYNPLGRNKRSVWWIATESFPGAHFATFPTALVEPCIKAGTSEYGCCPKCGAPWERVVKKGEPDLVWRKACGANVSGGYSGRAIKNYGMALAQDASETKRRILESLRVCHTVGWRPTCSCGIEETIPCTVLDPFGGAGTVSLVAKRLGRSSIYIDINPDYVEMAVNRLGNEPNLFEEHVVEVFGA